MQYLIPPLQKMRSQKGLTQLDARTAKNAKEVSGYTRLMELVDENKSIIQNIELHFSKIGYQFYNGNGNAGSKQASGKRKGHDEDKSVKLSAQVIKLLEPNIDLLFKNQLDSAFALSRSMDIGRYFLYIRVSDLIYGSARDTMTIQEIRLAVTL